MARGECEAAVGTAAREDGIELSKMPAVSWLRSRGHLHLPARAQAALPIMQRAFELLGGDVEAMRGKRLSNLPNDLLHSGSRTMVEVDESQHFISMRGVTLDLLEPESAGFDLREYRGLVAALHPRSDRYFAAKVTFGIPGPRSRGRGRAYFDLLRDVVAPLMGYRVVRVAAVEAASSDGAKGAAAYCKARERLLAATGSSALTA